MDDRPTARSRRRGSRSARRRRAFRALCGLAALAGAVGGTAACGGGARRTDLTPAQLESLKRSIAGADAVSAQSASGAGASAAASAPATEAKPPRDDAERLARVHRALEPGQTVRDIVPVGDGRRFVFALDSGPRARLLLVDVSREDGVVVGDHDFGAGTQATVSTAAGHVAPGTATEGAAASDTAGATDAAASEASSTGAAGASHASPTAGAAPLGGPAQVLHAIEVTSDDGQPIELAVVAHGADSVACGWWIRRHGTRFVCAPQIGGPSTYRVVDGALVEEWQAALPGSGGLAGVSGKSGRVLGVYGGSWRETDRFQCLGRPLEQARRDAGVAGVGAWQTGAVRERVSGARRAAQALDTDQAVGLLQDALAIDGCDPDAWRMLGRLEFERGRAAEAVPALAVGLALAPRDTPATVDLADALVVLNAGPPAGQASLSAAVEALDSHGTTHEIVEKARAASGGNTPSPRALAAALYSSFLERTDENDPRVAGARRRASDALARLAAPAPAVRRTSRARAPAKGRAPSARTRTDAARPAAARSQGD
ncbi:MAG TPA: hypothetical protein VFD92_28210 [Candidatus Binatia bacterium]|nr:hypothetical protein [Candidatus Binatia bacterium]